MGGENKLFSSFMPYYLENGIRYVLLLMTNKLHMRLRLAPKSVTLEWMNDLELL